MGSIQNIVFESSFKVFKHRSLMISRDLKFDFFYLVVLFNKYRNCRPMLFHDLNWFRMITRRLQRVCAQQKWFQYVSIFKKIFVYSESQIFYYRVTRKCCCSEKKTIGKVETKTVKVEHQNNFKNHEQ